MPTHISQCIDHPEAKKHRLKQKTENCPQHGEYNSFSVVPGIWTGCPKCQRDRYRVEIQNKLECARRQQIDTKTRKLLSASHLPERFQGKTLDNFSVEGEKSAAKKEFIGKVKSYTQSLLDDFKSAPNLIITGRVGNGKTHVVSAITRVCTENNLPALYAVVLDFYLQLRRSFNSKESASELDIIRQYSAIPVLILDEIGRQSGTDYEKNMLGRVLDERYRRMHPTIFVTNLSADQLSNFISQSNMSRIFESVTLLTTDWEDYRLKGL